MKLLHTRVCIVATIAAGLLAGCNQSANTAADPSTAKPPAAAASVPYNPANVSQAPPQWGNRATGHTIGHYGTGGQ